MPLPESNPGGGFLPTITIIDVMDLPLNTGITYEKQMTASPMSNVGCYHGQ